MISVEKEPLVKQNNKITYDSPNKLLKFSCNIAGFTKATLKTSGVSDAVVIA